MTRWVASSAPPQSHPASAAHRPLVVGIWCDKWRAIFCVYPLFRLISSLYSWHWVSRGWRVRTRWARLGFCYCFCFSWVFFVSWESLNRSKDTLLLSDFFCFFHSSIELNYCGIDLCILDLHCFFCLTLWLVRIFGSLSLTLAQTQKKNSARSRSGSLTTLTHWAERARCAPIAAPSPRLFIH